MAKYELLTQEHLEEILHIASTSSRTPFLDYLEADITPEDHIASMALELLEYRKIHGPLGCDWLENPEPAKTK